mgnify:CR=1 FL=1
MAILQWLESTEFADWVLTSIIGFPIMLSLHAVGMAVSMGLILVMDLRLLGFFHFISYDFLSRAILIAWAGLTINFLSGAALFTPRGVEYVGDPAFLMKMTLIVIGVANTTFLQRQLEHRSAAWKTDATTPASTKVWAAASMITWFGVITSGRLIAYVS